MRYYIDTEFIERPNTIDLISIGIKCEDGRTFYAESTDFDSSKADEWVERNVLPGLIWHGKKCDKIYTCNALNMKTKGARVDVFGSTLLIKEAILDFVGDDTPEFWGYYAAYDWVVFCWLFGAMVDLPKGWPMYCRDLKQLADDSGKPKLPSPEDEHNALVDAEWNMKFHEYLKL